MKYLLVTTVFCSLAATAASPAPQVRTPARMERVKLYLDSARAAGSGFVSVSSRPDWLCSDFTLPPGQPAAARSATTATDAVWKMKALPSENEEEEGADALDEFREINAAE